MSSTTSSTPPSRAADAEHGDDRLEQPQLRLGGIARGRGGVADGELREEQAELARRAAELGVDLLGVRPAKWLPSASTNGRYGSATSASEQLPQSTSQPSERARSASSRASRVLPIPASPASSTRPPLPSRLDREQRVLERRELGVAADEGVAERLLQHRPIVVHRRGHAHEWESPVRGSQGPVASSEAADREERDENVVRSTADCGRGGRFDGRRRPAPPSARSSGDTCKATGSGTSYTLSITVPASAPAQGGFAVGASGVMLTNLTIQGGSGVRASTGLPEATTMAEFAPSQLPTGTVTVNVQTNAAYTGAFTVAPVDMSHTTFYNAFSLPALGRIRRGAEQQVHRAEEGHLQQGERNVAHVVTVTGPGKLSFVHRTDRRRAVHRSR